MEIGNINCISLPLLLTSRTAACSFNVVIEIEVMLLAIYTEVDSSGNQNLIRVSQSRRLMWMGYI
jgi:hypothetical protein